MGHYHIRDLHWNPPPGRRRPRAILSALDDFARALKAAARRKQARTRPQARAGNRRRTERA